MIIIMIFFLLQDMVTPLLFAAEKGHVDILRTLVERGADVNAKSKV